MKRTLAVLMIFGCAALTACNKTGLVNDRDDAQIISADEIADTMTSKDGKYEIAMVTNVGRLKDKSFNQGTWDGVKTFAYQNGKSYKFYQPRNGNKASDDDRYNAFIEAISGGAKIIVATGYEQEKALKRAAAENPDTKFVFVDGYVLTDGNGKTLSNVAAVSFMEEQCGYLAGYAAVTEGNTKLGFVGGGAGNNPSVNRFGYGFVQGANDAAEITGASVEMKYSYLYGDSFSASPELQKMVDGWYKSGTQCVFSCGGEMCDSVFEAASDNNGKSIGVDVDQSSVSDTVITSAMKGLSAAAQKVLTSFYAGKWMLVGGLMSNLGVDDNAVGLPFATSKFEKLTGSEYAKLVNSMKSGGTLTVKNDFSAFLAGEETFENVAVSFVK